MQQFGAVLKARPAECRHSGAFVARNPAHAVGVWCDSCLRWVTKEVTGHMGQWLPTDHSRLAGVRVEDTPIRPQAWYRVCEKCGTFQLCEVHHMAPRAFFGDAADEWPTLYFCRKCHEAWHTLVTPGLCTAHDAVAHARQLFAYLGVDRARALWAAMKDEGLRRREAA